MILRLVIVCHGGEEVLYLKKITSGSMELYLPHHFRLIFEGKCQYSDGGVRESGVKSIEHILSIMEELHHSFIYKLLL